jgi:hypothetical protein
MIKHVHVSASADAMLPRKFKIYNPCREFFENSFAGVDYSMVLGCRLPDGVLVGTENISILAELTIYSIYVLVLTADNFARHNRYRIDNNITNVETLRT